MRISQLSMLDYEHLRHKIIKKLEKKLTSKRLEHTLRVEASAIFLSHLYEPENYRSASIAALLHDYGKNLPDDKKLELCNKYGLTLSESEKENIDLVHAKLDAAIAEHKFGISEKDLLNAIKYHTTGRPDMSTMEKIIYIADFIEPGRKWFEGMDQARKLSKINLDQCLFCILSLSKDYLSSKNKSIDPLTEETYLFYKSYNEKNK